MKFDIIAIFLIILVYFLAIFGILLFVGRGQGRNREDDLQERMQDNCEKDK